MPSNSVLLFTPGGWVGACNLAVKEAVNNHKYVHSHVFGELLLMVSKRLWFGLICLICTSEAQILTFACMPVMRTKQCNR